MKSNPDLRPCPFCGSEGLRYTILDISKEKVMAAVRCMQCLTCGPGECGKDREEADAKAAKAWNRRAEPENRVLTLAELEEHCKGGADAAPVWMEYKITKELSRWIYILEPEGVFGAQTIVSYNHNSNWRKRYGTFWRCWLRKPTAEEMAHSPWGELPCTNH